MKLWIIPVFFTLFTANLVSAAEISAISCDIAVPSIGDVTLHEGSLIPLVDQGYRPYFAEGVQEGLWLQWGYNCPDPTFFQKKLKQSTCTFGAILHLVENGKDMIIGGSRGRSSFKEAFQSLPYCRVRKQ